MLVLERTPTTFPYPLVLLAKCRLKKERLGFPGGLVVKTLSSQPKRFGFDP